MPETNYDSSANVILQKCDANLRFGLQKHTARLVSGIIYLFQLDPLSLKFEDALLKSSLALLLVSCQVIHLESNDNTG